MNYIVDRLEGEFAVCEREDMVFENILRNVLPKNVREGDVLVRSEDGKLVVDEECTKARREQIIKKMNQVWQED